MVAKAPPGKPPGSPTDPETPRSTASELAAQTLKERLVVAGKHLLETTAPEAVPLREGPLLPRLAVPRESPPTQPWGDAPVSPDATTGRAPAPPLPSVASGLSGTLPAVRAVADSGGVTEGSTVGRYRLVSRLGKGGMAETWKAQLVAAAGVTRPAVIKRILPHLAQNPLFTESFVNEARVSAMLSHGNIVQIFDFGEASGEYFIAMEYVHGRTLQAVLDRASRKGFQFLPPAVACFIAAEVLEALHYAHTRVGDDGQPLNIVHRDVSPDNVMLGFDGQTKLVDFGVAKARLEGRAETAPGMFKGKWTFFSPEQAEGRPLDGRSDVFAVGIGLYLMLTGRLPFGGEPAEAMQSIVIGRYKTPNLVNPLLSTELNAILTCALEADLSRRFASADEMEGALRRYLTKSSPDFSPALLKAFVLWLFEDELEKDGVMARPTAEQKKTFERWAADTHRAAEVSVASDTYPAGPPVIPTSGVTEHLPPTRRPALWIAGAVLAALAAALFFGTR